MQVQKSPLDGINIDIQHFKEMYQENRTIIQFTNYKNLLKSKEQIVLEIEQIFKKNRYVQFWFIGHGNFAGAMQIQTKQNPDGQQLLIEQIYDLWTKYESKLQRILEIRLDCCYSGKMAARLKRNRKMCKKSILVIVCSSGPNNISYDLQNFGGTLISQYWQLAFPEYVLLFERQYLKQKFQKSNPIRMFGFMEKWSEVQVIKDNLQYNNLCFSRYINLKKMLPQLSEPELLKFKQFLFVCRHKSLYYYLPKKKEQL